MEIGDYRKPQFLDTVVMRDKVFVVDNPQAAYDCSPFPLNDVTVVVASYRALKLIRQTIETFRAFYPDMAMVAVEDTGQFGPDPAVAYVQNLPNLYRNTRVIIHNANQTHGPSLHEGILAAGTRYVFTMDSDLVVRKAGLLEAMRRRMSEKSLLAIGQVYDSGYIATAVTMWDKDLYLKTPGLVRHSLPSLAMMAWFYDNPTRFQAESLPMWEEYITHIVAGTRGMFNSNRGWWDPSSPGAQNIWVGQQAFRGRDLPELQ